MSFAPIEEILKHALEEETQQFSEEIDQQKDGFGGDAVAV